MQRGVTCKPSRTVGREPDFIALGELTVERTEIPRCRSGVLSEPRDNAHLCWRQIIFCELRKVTRVAPCSGAGAAEHPEDIPADGEIDFANV